MDWLTITGIVILIVFAALVVAHIIVLLGGTDVRPLKEILERPVCPKCGEQLTAHATYPGLYMCLAPECKSWWQKYKHHELIEVFGTPYYEGGRCEPFEHKEGGSHD